MESLLLIAFLCLFLIVASACDIRTGRIPNLLNGCGLLVGIILCFASQFLGLEEQPPSWAMRFLGLALPLLLFPLFCMGSIGAGDIKLLMVTGFLTGTTILLPLLAYAVLVEALFGAALLVRRRTLGNRIRSVLTWLHCTVAGISRIPYERTPQGKDALRLPFAPFVALGMFCYLLFGNVFSGTVAL